MAERLKDDFREGQPLAGLSARWLNTVATFYNKLEMLYGSVIRAPDGKVTLCPYQAAPGATGGTSESSFAFSSVDGSSFFVYGGTIKWDGRGKYTFDDDASVQITGGSDVSPGYVSIRVVRATTNLADTTLVFTTTYPEDDGSYMFRVLHSAYLDGSGNAKHKRDLRNDIAIGSPI